MGTMLHREGAGHGCPELLNAEAPDVVARVSELYRQSGSDCSITNTFGGSRPRLDEYGLGERVEELNVAGVGLARRAGARYVLADVGPTGLVMEPLGQVTFDEAFDAFAEQMRALASAGPDAILIETMNDIAEARCAVLAARSVTDLPVIASVTMGSAGIMDISGTPPEVAAVVLEAAGADGVGINCGLGPEQMLPLLARMVSATRLPVIGQPNAGMPVVAESGGTVFPGTPEETGAFARAAAAVGVCAIGSCCGSTPAHTQKIAALVGVTDAVAVKGRGFARTVVAGPRRLVSFGRGEPVRVIGERINPTGKPDLKESLLAGSMSVVRAYAAEQQAAGADMLDVNVGAAGVSAADRLSEAVLALAGMSDLPLVLDTTDPRALESALRVYPGKALINSVNGDSGSMKAVLPLARRYGAALVVLALDDHGIPDSSAGRLEIVERVADQAAEEGIARRDLVVDGLVMTAATDAGAPVVTIETVSGAHGLGFATVLGISNVSHGMPDRALLNAAFFSAAVAAGLDAAIANPGDRVLMGTRDLANQAAGEAAGQATGQAAGQGGGERADAPTPMPALAEAMRSWDAIYAAAAAKALEGIAGIGAGAGAPVGSRLTTEDLSNRTIGHPSNRTIEDPLNRTVQHPSNRTIAEAAGSDGGSDRVGSGDAGPCDALEVAVLRGDAHAAPALADAVMNAGIAPERVIADVLTPAITHLGDAFGRGEVFLPQLIVAAEAMKAAVARVRERFPEDSAACIGRVVFATVKGDIHSIGKDICVSLLESQGIDVSDLGVDVGIGQMLAAAASADAVCLSALMTTTLPAMEATARAVIEQAGIPVFVGGAVVTEEWARSIGVGYAADAVGCVRVVRAALDGRG